MKLAASGVLETYGCELIGARAEAVADTLGALIDGVYLRRALDEFVVDGIDTTLPLFRNLVRNQDIQNGQYDIHWLEGYLKTGGLD